MSNNNNEAIISKVRELENKKVTFVTFDNVTKFLSLCNVLNIVAFGGAFATDMSGQWFYI